MKLGGIKIVNSLIWCLKPYINCESIGFAYL